MHTQTWDDLFNIQPLASKIITNSIKRNRVSHAYLFQGPRGSHKKTFATHFAMTLFCMERQSIDPCQQCVNCKRILSRNFPDVYWIEPDGQSIKNEQIKALRNEFVHTGVESARKVYIIDRAETLTINATNRILKFLEEPDTDIVAILLTDNGQKIIPTIRSRCQLIDFRPLDERAFRERLLEMKDISFNEQEATLLSALTNNINEALELHESKKVYHFKGLIVELIFLLLTKRKERYLYLHEKWLPQMKERKDFEQSLELLLLAFRDILKSKVTNMANTTFFHCEDALLKRSVAQFSQEQLLDHLEHILEAKRKIESNVHSTLVMEQLVLKL